MMLKRVGENIVPANWYIDPIERYKALAHWCENSLFPLFRLLEREMVNEFKLIPAMYSYEVCINSKWHKNVRNAEEIGRHITEEINRSACDYLQIQVVIDLLHPHVRWGTVFSAYLEKSTQVMDEENFECDVVTIEPMHFSIAEPLSLQAANIIIENVLIDLRINYVQNS